MRVRKCAETRKQRGKLIMCSEKIKITVCGNDISEYKISADLASADCKAAAEALKSAIYEACGVSCEISDGGESDGKIIAIKKIDKVFGSESFRVYTAGENLLIEYAFSNMLPRAVGEFIEEKIKKADTDLSGLIFNKDISVVCYDDFGAVGDGVADDFKALYDTHVFANECGQKVVASPDKKYYIFDNSLGTDTALTIPVKTDTDFCGANIIIDDTPIAPHDENPYYHISTKPIFEILPNDEHLPVRVEDAEILSRIVKEGLNPKTERINIKLDGWDGPMMLIPWNTGHRVFRRKGYGQFRGEPMHEVIVIDKDGRVSDETPIMFEYTSLDYITAYKLDESSAISFKNAAITTLASRVNSAAFDANGNAKQKGRYIARGISVKRSYTTVENINHVIENEYTLGECIDADGKIKVLGCCYQGMFTASNANRVTFKNCIIPGRRCYTSSTYNFRALCVNKIVLDGCVQSNFFITLDEEGNMTPSATYTPGAVPGMAAATLRGVSMQMQWGVGGTNYCKNMEYLNSTLSRFDAHAGLYNGKIINSNIIAMELTGVGEMIIENVNMYSHAVRYSNGILALRADYGYTWDGDIKIKDVNFYMDPEKRTLVTTHSYRNWYFGYTCAFPNITIDNLKLFDYRTHEPVSSDYALDLMRFYYNATKMHLLDSGVKAIFAVVDDNGDGYIDEPLYDINRDGLVNELDRFDVDGNGVVGETSLRYDEVVEKLGGAIRGGIEHPTCTTNLCIVKPPKYYKVINNAGGYKYNVIDTSGDGVSDGAWYSKADTPDSFGGFFGTTEFIYGEGKGEYVVGTDHDGIPETGTFNFTLDYYYPPDVTPVIRVKKRAE